DLCRLVLEKEEEQGGPLADLDPEVLPLVLWGAGNIQEALDRISQGEKWARASHRPTFSYWRYRLVSAEQYLDDCRQLRRMIQGEPVRPAFLEGPATRSDGPHSQ